MSEGNTWQLSNTGRVRVEVEAEKKFYRAKQRWANEAFVSLSTLKRFLRQTPIRSDYFINICQAIDLDYLAVGIEPNNIRPRSDLLASPRIDCFFGRDKDLTVLSKWITTDKCSFIAITAFGGTGKSYLTKKLATEVEADFAGVYWVDLHNAPPIELVFNHLIRFLSDNQEIEIPQGFAACWLRLLTYLAQSKWLIVFDNVESILDANQSGIKYRGDRSEYQDLFINLAKCEHNSTIIVTSREQLPGIKPLASQTSPVRIYRLLGIDNSAVGILRHQKIVGSDAQLQAVIAKYQGNPLGINVAAGVIKGIYRGDLELFLAQDKTVFSDVETILDEQWAKLSDREKSLMYGLALNRAPILLENIQHKLILDLKPYEIDDLLNSLSDRHLVQINEEGFTLQNVVKEYITRKIIDRAILEIKSEQLKELSLLDTHCLLEASAPDFIRTSQYCTILQPILEGALIRLPLKVLINKILKLIALLRHTDSEIKNGFAPGNIINLLVSLQADFTSADFSGLSIRQAYLQQVPLPQVNFRGCYFENTLFSLALGSILAVAFNPEQTLLATGGTDGYIRIWQVVDGEEIVAWQAHEGWIRVVRFSDNGMLLASGGNDKIIKVWHWQNQQLQNRLEGHQDWVWSLDFTQQDSLLISTSTDRTAKVWSLEKNVPILDYNGLKEIAGAAWSIAFSPDQNTFASGTVEKVQLWDLNQKQLIRDLPKNSSRVRALCFSPDGKYLAGSNDQQKIVIWEVATGEELQTLPVPPTAAVWSLKYTPDGDSLISCGTNSIQIWDMVNYQSLKTMQQPYHRIRSLAYSEKQHLLAVGSDDQMIGIWDTDKGESVRTIYSYNNRIWALDRGKIKGLSVIAGGSDDGKVRIWDGKTGKLRHTLSGHNSKIRTVRFCPQNRLLASAGSDRTLLVWDLDHLERQPTIYRHHTDLIWQNIFIDNGNSLISFSDDKKILKTDLRLQKTESFPVSAKEWNWSAAVNPQENILALAGDSSTVDLWDIATRAKISSLAGFQHRVKAIAFNQAGDLISVSEYNSIKIWNLKTSSYQEIDGNCHGEIRCLKLIPQPGVKSELIATAGDDCLIRIYNRQNSKPKILEGHQGSVWSLTYCPDLNYLYSCGEDESLKIWNLINGELVDSFSIPKLYEGMNLEGVEGLSEIKLQSLRCLGAR